MSKSNQASGGWDVAHREGAAIIRIFTEAQVAVVGRRKEGKSVCAPCLCKEKRRSQGCAQKRFVLSSPSSHHRFPHHRFPHQTPHFTPETHSSAAGCGLCKVNSNAITNHSTHLLSPRRKTPLLEGYQIPCRSAAGLLSPDFVRANKSRLYPFPSNNSPFQPLQHTIERDASKVSIGLACCSVRMSQNDLVELFNGA